ncbi:MAG: PAS domain S-box protein, partial [Thermoplasmata archaeon]
LDEEEIDVVVSDYKMPGMDGLQLFRTIREKKIMVPFIILTGKGTEKTAIEALNLGVNRYFRKTGDPESLYKRLIDAIHQEVDEKKIEPDINRKDHLYGAIFEHAQDAIFIMKGDKFIDCNPKAEEMFNAPKEELVGTTPYNKYSPERQFDGTPSDELAKKKIEEAYRGESKFFEWRHRKKGGEEFCTEVSLNRFESEGEEYLIAIVRDITDKKEAERELLDSKNTYRSIYDTMLELSKTNDLQLLIKIIVDKATELLDANDCAVYLADEEKNVFEPIYSNHPKYDDEILSFKIPFGKGLTGHVYEEGEPIRLNFDEEDPYSIHIPGTDSSVDEKESVLSAPLFQGDDVIGALTLGKEKEKFREKDIEKLMIFAKQAELVIKRGELIEELKNSRERISKTKDQMKSLLEFASKLQSTSDEKGIYEITVKAAEEILEYDICVIHKAKGDKLEAEAVSTNIPHNGYKDLPLHGSLGGRTFRNKRSYLSEDISELDEVNPALDDYKSVISIPIGDYGVFQAISTEKAYFDENDLETAELLISHTEEALKRVQYQRNLEESEERYRRLVEFSPDAIVVHKDGKCVFINRVGAQLLGFEDPEDAIGTPIMDIVHKDYKEEVEENILNMERSGGASPISEQKFCRVNDGECIDVDVVGSPIKYEGEDAIQVIFRDITDRKRAEEELKRYKDHLEELVDERTAELQELTDHLRAFTHSVTHDLRAPLRAMEGFSEALLEDYSRNLDETGERYATRIRDAAERMDILIKDLWEYSKITSKEMVPREVDLDYVVKEAKMNLKSSIREKGAEIEVQEDLPSVMAHRSIMVQVLTNLISNSIKFVDDETTPSVKIYAEEKGDKVRLWIEDNGIGIEPQYQDSIFEMLTRLHGIEQYPGTGVGLAIVRRGVQRMRGEVGVESEKGEGSRFWIELKKA